MWSLGYTQVKIDDPTQTDLENSLTLTDLKISPESNDTENCKPLSTNENSELTTSSTNSEYSDSIISNVIQDLTQPNLIDSIKENSNIDSLSMTSSCSESETVNLNIEQKTIKQKEDQNSMDETLQVPTLLNTQISNSDEFEDEFLLIDPSQFTMPGKKYPNIENESILKQGYKWQRELIFRSKLTMHTSFDRKDNSEPASVTALSISKDNKTIYVGDSRGRVYTWVCTENPGKTRADHWMRDEVVETCKNKSCNVKFSINVRKHHRRNCGGIFCNNCTRYETVIPRLHIIKPVKVCIECYNNIKAEEALIPPSLITNNKEN